MGKKRIVTQTQEEIKTTSGGPRSKKHKLTRGTAYISSSYNNTIVTIANPKGEVVVWSSAGLLGFRGTRKSTPYAATLVAKDAIEKAVKMGLTELRIILKGVGPGREGAVRGIAGTGVNITSIIDSTPVPHGGVRPRKPRRV
jgi:small subunit ribosomal protein S11